jgi:uncharacterized membrane protein
MTIPLLQAAMAAGLTVLPIIAVVLLTGILLFTLIIYNLLTASLASTDGIYDNKAAVNSIGKRIGIFLLSLAIAMGISFVLVLLGILLLSGFIPDIEYAFLFWYFL